MQVELSNRDRTQPTRSLGLRLRASHVELHHEIGSHHMKLNPHESSQQSANKTIQIFI